MTTVDPAGYTAPVLQIVMEGGLVIAVLDPTTGQTLVGRTVVVIDYDTEGSNEEALVRIRQSDGSYELAAVSAIEIEPPSIAIMPGPA